MNSFRLFMVRLKSDSTDNGASASAALFLACSESVRTSTHSLFFFYLFINAFSLPLLFSANKRRLKCFNFRKLYSLFLCNIYATCYAALFIFLGERERGMGFVPVLFFFLVSLISRGSVKFVPDLWSRNGRLLYKKSKECDS